MEAFAAMEETEITIEIECTGLPGAENGPLALGIQRDEAITELESADAKQIVFKPILRARRNPDGSANFLGPFAHGPKFERFIYLNWVTMKGKVPMAQIGRIKLHLNHLKWDVVVRMAEANKPLRVKLALTNAKGKPVMASVREDVAKWNLPK